VTAPQPKRRATTLLELLFELLEEDPCPEQQLVARALARVLSGRVVLRGIFATGSPAALEETGKASS